MKPIAKGGKFHVQIDEKYIKMDGKGHKTRCVTATVFDRISSHGKKNRLERRTLISVVELGERLDFGSEYAPDRWHIAHFLSTDGHPVGARGVIKRLKEIERGGDMTGLGEDAIKVYKLWEKDKSLFDVWSHPEYKGCCQEAMNSNYYAARFGKFGGSFKKKTVKKLSLDIDTSEMSYGMRKLFSKIEYGAL